MNSIFKLKKIDFPSFNFEHPLNSAELFLNRLGIERTVKNKVRKEKDIIYGAQAMNIQLPLFLQRPTEDYDIYARNPRREANKTQKELDNEFADGRNEFYSEPAIHKGTYRVKHIGDDSKRETSDDIVIADFTSMPQDVPVVRIESIKYETLGSIVEHKKKILQDKKSAYRHEKDKEDLERIRASKLIGVR